MLDYRLTIPCLEKLAYYEFKTKYVDFDRCFGKIQAMEMGMNFGMCSVGC
jgi:hypothetical protein